MSSKITEIKSRLKGTALGTFLRRYKWNRGLLARDGIVKKVNECMPDATSEEKDKAVKDILNMARKYRFSADEYFYYHFRDKTEEERKSFCSDLNRIDICESLNDPRNLALFNDKIKTYELFGQYYGREICGITSGKELDKLMKFAQRHPRFMVKPVDSSCGQGIQIVDLSDCDDREAGLEALIAKYCAGVNGGLIAEELIVQAPELAQIYPNSVNTIRVTTIRCDDGIEILPPFLKVGRGGNIVDNGGAGGIFGAFDMITGKIIAMSDKHGRFYTTHPDTGFEMIGFTIPRWEEAMELAKKLAMVVPENRYTGWDLALTEKGWVMVEGNARGQFIGWQISLQRGFMSEINGILRRMGRPELKKTGI